MGKKHVDIQVVLESDNPVKFSLTPNPPLPPWNKKNEFVFENQGHDGFLLRYILHGNALGYRFPDDHWWALFSKEGAGCPDTEGQWEQFEGEYVKPGNKVLVVRNKNQCEAEFSYTLRLTKTPHMDNPHCIDLDPGGMNKNGSTFSATTAVVVAVGTAAAMALALFGLKSLRGK